MANKAFQKLKAGIKAQRKVLGIDRRADFRMAEAGLDSIFNNLVTTQAGLSQSLSEDQARTLARMEALAQKSARTSARGVTRAGTRARSLFGSALGQEIGRTLGPARAIAESTGMQARTGLGAGRLLARGATEAMGIQQAAASEAQAGADYALAQALRYRAKDDAELVAQQQLALQQMKLQFSQEKAMARFNARLEEKAATGPGGERLMGAQESLLQMAMDPGATAEQLQNTARAMELTYNLAPGSLTTYVGTLFDAEGKSTVAAPLTDAQGNIIQTSLDDEDKTALKSAAVEWLKNHPATTTPEKSRENFISSLVSFDPESQSWVLTGSGQVVSQQLAQETQEYAGAQWDAAAPTFYETTAAIKASEEQAKQDVMFGKASNMAASFLGLDDGDVGLDTVLTVASFFLPVTRVGKAAAATGGKLVAAGLGRAGAKGAQESLLALTERLAARAATQAAKTGTTTAATGVAGGTVRGITGRMPAATTSAVARGAAERAAASELSALSAEHVAARTGQMVLRAAATEGVDKTKEAALRELLVFLQDPYKAAEWKRLLEFLVSAPV